MISNTVLCGVAPILDFKSGIHNRLLVSFSIIWEWYI